MTQEISKDVSIGSKNHKTMLRHWSRWGCFIFFALFFLLVPAACQYQSPLLGITGYKTQLVSNPGYFGSPVKWVQAFFEIIPCRYNLLGWDESNKLYYQSVCYNTEQLWQYDLQEDRSYRIETKPFGMYVQVAKRDNILKIVRAEGVRPRQYEPSVRRVYLIDPGLVSPDGQHTAIITQRVYSVFDVVVLGTGHG